MYQPKRIKLAKYIEEKKLFECGADAMLTSLTREGNSKGGRVKNDPHRANGTWLFMPEEEDIAIQR
jgi:hypothetical protein